MIPVYVDQASRLGNAIIASVKSYVVLHKAKQRIEIHNKNNIFFLKKGNVAAYSYEGQVLVFNTFAPEILCLEKVNKLKIISYLRCITDCEMHVIDAEDFRDILDNQSLWPDAFDVISQYLYIYYYRDNTLTRPTVRESIIHYLKFIWTLPPQRRETTSIYSFLTERTHISRSLIHKVVADLQKENMVTVERGILKKCSL